VSSTLQVVEEFIYTYGAYRAASCDRASLLPLLTP